MIRTLALTVAALLVATALAAESTRIELTLTGGELPRDKRVLRVRNRLLTSFAPEIGASLSLFKNNHQRGIHHRTSKNIHFFLTGRRLIVTISLATMRA